MTTRAEEIAAKAYPHSADRENWTRDERLLCDGITEMQRAAFVNGYKQGQQDRWIPVSERLPEMREESRVVWQSSYVLVRIDRETDEQYRTKLAFLCQLNGGDAKWRSAGLGGNVTHWMPLPSPPNPEQR